MTHTTPPPPSPPPSHSHSDSRSSVSLPLFGPPRAWREDEFVASDDRVRGGSSQSHLSVSSTLQSVRFHGTLDTTTLGGAGFASQRTTTTRHVWDLTSYNGIELDLGVGDAKKYTLNIKTCIPEKMQNGRDASTVEYAFSFVAPVHPTRIFASWAEFKPFYRGKPKPDAEPLNVADIRRWSLMMRSFFEEQSGPFSLTIKSIKARHQASSHGEKQEPYEQTESDSDPPRLAKFCAIL